MAYEGDIVDSSARINISKYEADNRKLQEDKMKEQEVDARRQNLEAPYLDSPPPRPLPPSNWKNQFKEGSQTFIKGAGKALSASGKALSYAGKKTIVALDRATARQAQRQSQKSMPRQMPQPVNVEPIPQRYQIQPMNNNRNNVSYTEQIVKGYPRNRPVSAMAQSRTVARPTPVKPTLKSVTDNAVINFKVIMAQVQSKSGINSPMKPQAQKGYATVKPKPDFDRFDLNKAMKNLDNMERKALGSFAPQPKTRKPFMAQGKKLKLVKGRKVSNRPQKSNGYSFDDILRM